MSDKLEDAKERVRAKLRAGLASGIVGVGIDPAKGKLLIFYSNKKKAENFLRNEFGDSFFTFVELYSGKIRGQESRPVSEGVLGFLKALLKRVLPVPLKPASRIQPDNGNEGRVGCFVSLNGGAIGVLTVEHLFFERTLHEVKVKTCKQGCERVAGTTLRFGGLQAGVVNLVDCALFSPSADVVLTPKKPMTGRFIAEAALKDVEKRTVETLVQNGSTGRVLDVDAAISYDVYLPGQGRQSLLFDNQILIESLTGVFGVEGHSGALVVIAQDEFSSSFRRGDAVGLYSVITDTGDFHFATPFHTCLTVLEASGIHLP